MSDLKNKITIGFDLGTTSVGWSIIKINSKEINNENLEILDMGVRLFDDPSSKDVNNEKRRIARGRRRRINRSRIRKHDLYLLLKKYNLIKDDEEFKNFITSSVFDETELRWLIPLDIKIKGLTQQLTKHEIVLILHNYIKHRGTLNTIDIDDEKEEKNKEKLSQTYDKSKLPCQNQLEWFKSTGKVLGNKENSIITNEEFKKEISIILNNQKLIDNKEFINEFISLFERHRHYSIGPGGEKSPTPYGLWRINESNKIEKIGETLWEELIGKCTYYPNEPRNYKKSPITEYFNLLNDFANMKLKDEKGEEYLSIKDKQMILSKSTYDKLTLDKFLKIIKLEKRNIIGGLRKDTKDNYVIEELKSIKKISSWLITNNIKSQIDFSNINDIKYIDDIFKCGVIKQNKKERFDNFKNNYSIFNSLDVTDEMITKLCEEKIWSSGTSGLSSKAQLDFINYSLNDQESIGKNQMFYFQEKFNELTDLNNKFSKYKYFPNGIFDNEILPKTVRRTFNQAIKVLNEILSSKKYRAYEISHIFIELAREMNSADEADNIKKELDRNKKYLNEKMKEFDVNEDQLKRGENRLKFILWCEQNKYDLYDGELIDLNEMLSNPQAYHIDHILPISSSLNDSMANKVVTKAINNEKKKDQTPYYWLNSQGKYEQYKDRCLNLINHIEEKNKKMKSRLLNKINNYLLYEKDIDNELQGFVSRQLNDSRYISILFSNQLKLFFKYSNYWKNKKIIISPVNGVLTTFARKNWFAEHEFDNKLLIKNRDIYSHHAIDASIIAFLGLNSNIQKLLSFKHESIRFDKENNRYFDINTGEVSYEKSDFLKEQSKSSKYFQDQMRDFLNKNVSTKYVKYSRMIENKTNLALSNETLYSLKEYDGIKYKITKMNLLDSKTEDLQKYFSFLSNIKDHSNKVICYLNDRPLYDELKKIFNEYYQDNKTNPFYLYLNSEFVKNILKENKIDITKLDKIPLIDLSGKIYKWVRNIRIKENEIKDISDKLVLFDKSKSCKKHNGKAFYDSLKPLGVRVYKTNDNKYILVFINALIVKWDKKLKCLVIDKDKLNQKLIKLNVDVNSRFIEFKPGKIMTLNGELFYYVGGTKNLMELKIISMKNELAHKISNWKDAPNREQWQISISTIADKFKLCKVDALGNIYDVWTFDEYFENDMLKY